MLKCKRKLTLNFLTLQQQQGSRSLWNIRGPLDWDAPTMSVWCEPTEIMLTESRGRVLQLEITLRAFFFFFVLVSEWSVGLLLLTTAERSQEPTQALRFVVMWDPCTFPMQGSPDCIFLCDQREGRVKHYWQRCFAPFDAKLIRGYKSWLSLPQRSWGMVQKKFLFQKQTCKEQSGFFFLFWLNHVCFHLLLTLIVLGRSTQKSS